MVARPVTVAPFPVRTWVFHDISLEVRTMGIMMISPLLSLLAGVAILVWPRLLNYIVAFYLIFFGLLGFVAQMQ